MQPYNLTPEDAALMGLSVLDRGDARHWDATELDCVSLGVLFLPTDEDSQDEPNNPVRVM